MADAEHVTLVKSGFEGFLAWREQNGNRDVVLDLSGANLSGVNLGGHIPARALYNKENRRKNRANCRKANLSKADLTSANLSGANLTATRLGGANLTSANLNEVNLYMADLARADLSGADLSRANFSWADLTGARLNLPKAKRSGAKFTKAKLGGIVDESGLPRPADAVEPAVETLPRVVGEPGPDPGTLPRASEA